MFNVFYSKLIISGYFVSILLVITGGFFVKKEGASLLLILLGCVIFTNIDAPAKYMANRVITLFHGNFPRLVYYFYEDYMQLKDKETMIPYDNLIKIVEDEEYYYLFQTRQYGIMIRKNSVSCAVESIGLKQFIEEKTGLRWEKPPTIMNINLKALRNAFRR